MKRMDSKKLGRLAVSVRGLREDRTATRARLDAIEMELAQKEPILDEALGVRTLVAIEGTTV